MDYQIYQWRAIVKFKNYVTVAALMIAIVINYYLIVKIEYVVTTVVAIIHVYLVVIIAYVADCRIYLISGMYRNVRGLCTEPDTFESHIYII